MERTRTLKGATRAFALVFWIGAPAAARITPGSVDWQTGGPFGGTITGLVCPSAAEPQRLLAATWGGGIFVSEDQGASCARAAGLTSWFLTSITVSPHDPNVLYAGVEHQESYIPLDQRSKLVESTDGGRTWFESSTGIQDDWDGRSIPIAVAVSTTDPDVVYAGCHRILVPTFYRSTDGGATWTRADNGHVGYSHVVSVHPANGDDAVGRRAAAGCYVVRLRMGSGPPIASGRIVRVR